MGIGRREVESKIILQLYGNVEQIGTLILKWRQECKVFAGGVMYCPLC